MIEFASGSVRSVEAVVRWADDGEEVPAGEFLAVAEETGLIVQLGEWVRSQACRQVAAWRAAGIDVGLTIAFSARQVSVPGFVTSLLAVLDDAGLPPAALTVKVERPDPGGRAARRGGRAGACCAARASRSRSARPGPG